MTHTIPTPRGPHSPESYTHLPFYRANSPSIKRKSSVRQSLTKSKFGDVLQSKTRTAQINEALCKILCHNVCVLIQSMHELNLKPKFYQAA